jgi:hypothetical protein
LLGAGIIARALCSRKRSILKFMQPNLKKYGPLILVIAAFLALVSFLAVQLAG